MRVSLLHVLRSTAAVGAIALGSASANAACTTTNNVVTCSDANTTDQVNSSLNNAPPPSVSLIIREGAIVPRGFSSQISPSSFRFPGAIGYTNSGTVGTPGANVDFTYFGSFNNSNPANTFTFSNSGTQNGGIFAFGVGGAINGTNSGTVTRGIFLNTVGPINFTNSGTVFTNSSFFFDRTAIRLTSARSSFQFTDGVFRSSETGSVITATLGGTVGIPATGTTAFRPQDIQARGVDGVDITVSGNVGRVFASSGGGTSEGRFTSTFTDGTSTSIFSFSGRSSGGDARVTLTESGRATDLVAGSRSGAATVVVNGTITGGGASASAFGGSGSFSSTSTFNFRTGAGNSQSSGTFVATGGAALADVGATGRVAGNVSASSNAGSATVRIAGVVGNANSTGSFFFSGGSISAVSEGRNSSFQSRSVSQSFGSFESSSSSTESSAGGAALATVAATGQVFGSAMVRGDGSATLDNAGRILGSVATQSQSSLVTSTFNSSGTVTTGAGGSRTQTNTSTSTNTFETLGGTASVVNRAGAAIGGTVQVTGGRSGTLNTAGTIGSSVSLNSTGGRGTSTSTGRNTFTTKPGTGGTETTSLGEFSSSSSSRAIGGAVTGTYSGTVGKPSATNRFAFPTVVEQNGSTASTATVTGTLFANFNGRAGAQNSDRAHAFTGRETTQPSGASTRDQASRSTESLTQIASSSSLTVGSTGRVVNNGSNSGNVTLSSAGGDATFINDGRVDGNVAVNAGAGSNTARTSEFSASFTRPAPAPRSFFTPEVQQSQTSSSTSDDRRVSGIATATVNTGGSVGGNLALTGSGTGAGSLAANALVNGTVGGAVNASAFRTDTRTSNSSTAMRTGPNSVTGSRTSFTSFTPSAESGNVLVTVNGTAGGAIVAAAGAESATVNLNGRAGTTAADGIRVRAFDFARTTETNQTFAGSPFFFFGPLTSSRVTRTGTAVGGTATLNVAASTGIRAAAQSSAEAAQSSAEGDIIVQGFSGSTLNIAAGARILQNTGRIFVGASFANSTSTTTGAFTGGTQTGSTTTTTTTFNGGPAVINNAGLIGSAANNTRVSAFGVGGATINNSGTINGSLVANATTANRTTRSTVTDQNDPARRRTVTATVTTPVGGLAQVNNTGLVTGGITVVGATGTVTNSGVVRGRVTLGGDVNNFSTTTTTTNTVSGTGAITPVTVTSRPVANPTLFTQNYTLNQNGLVLSGIAVTGTTTPVGPSREPVRTSNVNATVNLNNGSITLGNITAGTDTNTNLNLNGSGFLGIALNEARSVAGPGLLVTAAEPIASIDGFTASASRSAAVPGQAGAAFQPTASIARFTAIDPTLAGPDPLPAGSRVSGVRTLTKTGDGTFVIVGAPLLAGGTTATPVYTLDVGTLRVNGGELQLGLTGTNATANFFGIRGNVENNANLVIGRRITDGTRTAIQGINVSVLGNVTNAATGNLVVGVNPTFARSSATGPFVPFGPGSPLLASTNSFVRVDGNLTLAGNVAVQAPPGGLFEAGRLFDLFSVSGSYTNTGTVRSSFASPFVSFVLTPRSEGGRTIVSLNAARANFNTVTTDRNSTNAANALQATLPTLFNGLRAGAGAPNAAFVQDLANIVSALDTQLTAAQAAQVFNELSSGEIYGSLSAISTTEPFGEATDGLSTPGKEAGFGLWFRPTGQLGEFRANEGAGASAIDVNNHGGSIGLNFATGDGGHAGIAGGYGKLEVDAVTPERAEAETYMVSIYAAQQLGGLHLSGQAVYGKSDWHVTRRLPLLARVASGSFDSEEIRATLRAAYTIAMLPDFDLSPFAKVEARRYKFDGFTETGANAVSLVVDRRAKTVVSPEIGLRMSGALGSQIRPFAEASYIFQGDVGSDRNVSFVSNPSATFSLEGVDPRHTIKGAAGVAVDFGRGTFFFRGDYGSGGDQRVGSVRSGLLFNF